MYASRKAHPAPDGQNEMATPPQTPRASSDEEILQQQYLRSLSSFEGIILGQIDIKNRLGDRLNYSIQAGIIILGAIAVSILILLLTLTSQINRISAVVADMNKSFTTVSDSMHRITGHMESMEKRIALLEGIESTAAVMDEEMQEIRSTVDGIGRQIGAVRGNVTNIATTMEAMNAEIHAMGAEMHHMAKPARSMNKMFPFP
jgi:methyl-accepting chemotaxis protein